MNGTLNRRVAASDNLSSRVFVYSIEGQVLEAEDGAAPARYVWSPVYVNALILRDELGNSPSRIWAVQDANWNVVALVNDPGAVVERYAYTPFGEASVQQPDGTPRPGLGGYNWLYRFQGGRYDPVTGTTFFQNRDYDPIGMRWMTPDPLGYAGGDLNVYRPMGNNPATNVDPSGLSWFSDFHDWWFDNRAGDRIEGVLQVTAGVSIALAGSGIATAGTIVGFGVGGFVAIPVGAGLGVVGIDQTIAGFRKIWDGGAHPSFVGQGVTASFGGGGETFDDVAQFVGAWRATTQILELGFAKFGPRLAEHSGWFGRVLFRGMQNEPAWNKLPPFQKYLYEVGQNTLRSNVYQRYSHIVDSVAKGRAMVTDFGYIRATFGGGFRKISAEGTMQTGATPGGRWLVRQVLGAGAGASTQVSLMTDAIKRYFYL